MVKNLKLISRLNIHYYSNPWYKSYITSLKAIITGESLISVGLDINRILHFVFLIKYSKFTNNIGSGNFTDIFCQNTDKFQKTVCVVCVCVGGGGRRLHPSPPYLPTQHALGYDIWYILFGIYPHTPYTPKFWHMYMITYILRLYGSCWILYLKQLSETCFPRNFQ